MALKYHKVASGFTLIEMLVVITLIGILASVVGLRYGTLQESARDTARLSDLNQLALTLNLYKQDHGNLPAESGVICSNQLECPALNTISEIVRDLGLMVGDSDRYVYTYTESEACNSQYTVATLRTTVEIASNSNATEKQARCQNLAASADEYIMILEYFRL